MPNKAILPHPGAGFNRSKTPFSKEEKLIFSLAMMGCLIGCLALVTPRLAIVLVVLFSNYIGRAYETLLWPILGFLFMPLTTLAYAWAVNTNGSVTGVYLVVVVIAVLLDLGLIGGGGASARRRRKS